MSGTNSFIEPFETVLDTGALGEQTDRQLLDRITGPDRTAAEPGFTILVKRHGPAGGEGCRREGCPGH